MSRTAARCQGRSGVTCPLYTRVGSLSGVYLDPCKRGGGGGGGSMSVVKGWCAFIETEEGVSTSGTFHSDLAACRPWSYTQTIKTSISPGTRLLRGT